MTVEVDVDLDDFDLEDVIEYVFKELQRTKQKEELKKFRELIGVEEHDGLIDIQSLDDKIKYEHLSKVFHKYTTDFIEKQLPI